MRKERCTRQFALNAEKNAKCHSSPMAADLYTAESATQKDPPQEEIDSRFKRTTLRNRLSSIALFFFKSHKEKLSSRPLGLGFGQARESL
jgi:hypothetical protein